ncbi:MAG: 2-dehydro-3-deoxyphosphogluconate aldolase / (4S)-4-hydroxy-2-oxoglutarate aldolase [Verrucomicrobiota bacterium]|jgi:2-dehydro-3-deoxyphosphogluconate aldolase/(4S)-4-hydroxy-2-oxoglutarate aldolase
MRSRAEIVSLLTDPGIVAVVRTDKAEQVPFICEALLTGGIHSIEITFTVPDAALAIHDADRRFGARALIGAGTVLNVETAQVALDAGAQFIVSPVLRTDLVAAAHAAGRPVMLGAYTPTEAQAAHEAGADFIKIFPADKLGPAYIRALRGPLPHLKLVPTGGVDLQTAADFLRAGCVALGLGGSLLTAEILGSNNWTALSRLAADYVKIARAVRAAKA